MGSLRIGTWNLEHGAGAAKNAERVARLLDVQADVWILTETHDDVDLSATHTAVRSSARSGARAGGRWATVWSRWPGVVAIDVADQERTAAARIDTPFGPLVVYGTVLPWHADPGADPGKPARSWEEHDRVIAEQVVEWQALCRRFPEARLVVGGDLNMNLGGKHYYGTVRGRTALRAGMHQVGLACATEAGEVPAGMLRYPPIDHVLVPTEWAALSRVASAWEGRTAGGRRLSDHSGVVVEIRELPVGDGCRPERGWGSRGVKMAPPA